ncbi:hypothetical protein OPV22_022012 [Ensete ventricosum]|uniref:Uncharacterized protein n=1 Tax=Ensete ventricosum TaxID=4639 RepID=A0AAV8QRK0_ENSVE|nr:hypothetical protein OPV22_022012 [Ensete ventricosum]
MATTAATASSSSVASISQILHRDCGSQSRPALSAKVFLLFQIDLPRRTKRSLGEWVVDAEWRKRKERCLCLLHDVCHHHGSEEQTTTYHSFPCLGYARHYHWHRQAVCGYLVGDRPFTVGLGFLMLSMGLTLTFEDFRRCLRNPWTVGVGFLPQYLIKPMMGFTIAMIILQIFV